MKELSIIIVNYKASKYLKGCIESIYKHGNDIKSQIIVVNTDNSDYKLKSPNVTFINVTNHGYGAGINEGFKLVKFENLLIMNPDVILKSDLDKAINGLDKTLGIIGASLITDSGKEQPFSHGEFHNLKTILINKIFNRQNTAKIDWVSGAVMLMKSNLFKKLNGFDASYFMYFEDQDICYRAKKLGESVNLIPEFKAVHYGGKSFGEQKNPVQLREYNKSMFRFIGKNGSALDLFLIKTLKPMYDFYKSL